LAQAPPCARPVEGVPFFTRRSPAESKRSTKVLVAARLARADMTASDAFASPRPWNTASSWARSRAPAAARPIAIVGVAVAVVLAGWLRLHGLADQVVQDDEWHALHKLLNAGYGEIFGSFGYSDHSIPLTLFYKAMAAVVGLDEIDMRIVQAACGIALVGTCGFLAWKATAQAPTAILFAFLVAGAPLLVLYSRFARPYAIATLLTVIALAALWRWKHTRSRRLAVVACLLAALATWLHILSALFPAAALVAILAADLEGAREGRARALRSTVALGAAMAVAIAVFVAVPLIGDFQSLRAKAGESVPDAYTLVRVVALFAGGVSSKVAALVAMVAVFGAWRFARERGEVGHYLAIVALAPVLAMILAGAAWSQQGHTFARYVFPTQVIFLFWCAYGLISVARILGRGVVPALGLFVATTSSAAYLAFTPAIGQVSTLGPWYGHALNNYDYVGVHNVALRLYDNWETPRFYHELAAMPAGTAPIIHAPFHFAAPFNPDAFYARLHHQPELEGFVHDLCLRGPYYGELPRDRRFRFRRFVYLDDRDAVLATGARYLVFQRERRNEAPFVEAQHCLEALKRLYGDPFELDERLAVFDLQRLRGARTIQ
jgi:hypothetical protein